MSAPNTRPDPERGPLRPISEEQAHKLRQYEIDYRFVREVERLEREGRVPARFKLEKELGMTAGVITEIRQGKRGVLPVHIQDLKLKYNADYVWILFGVMRDLDNSSVFMGGRKLPTYKKRIVQYKKTAQWKCGPRPEEVTAHYPEDPENKLWTPHEVAGKHAKALKKERPADEGEAK